MKSLLLLDLHSTVDIITNSSSEIFVCNTDKSLEFVKEWLEKALELINIGGVVYQYDEVFGELEIIDESNVDKNFNSLIVNTGYFDWKWKELGITQLEDCYDWKENYKKLNGLIEKYPWHENRKINIENNKKAYEAWDLHEKQWKDKYFEKIKPQLIGKIIISSASDNSIPFGLFDLIESTFNGERFHIG